MKQIGILFQDDMVRAILDGRKTLTSRLINPQPYCPRATIILCAEGWKIVPAYLNNYDARRSPLVCRYQPGDVLIGRETWQLTSDKMGKACIQFRADGKAYEALADEGGTGDWVGIGKETEPLHAEPPLWKSSVLMPWKFSRLRLEVVKEWPSRLEDMTEEMALQEGVYGDEVDWADQPTPLMCYEALWDRINGKKHPWYSNPWVWKIAYKRL